MMYSRYSYAASAAAGKRVLEIACGSGVGIGMVNATATFCVGGDIDERLLLRATTHYGTRLPFVRFSAEELPFKTGAFDVVLFFEATYYVPQPRRSFAEITRVLTPGGMVIFVNANPERPDFIPSPMSHQYHNACTFRRDLADLGLDVRTSFAFPIEKTGFHAHLLRLGRSAMQRSGLVPRSLAARAVLKRFAYGRLIKLPPEIHAGFATATIPSQISSESTSNYKVIYVEGIKRSTLDGVNEA